MEPHIIRVIFDRFDYLLFFFSTLKRYLLAILKKQINESDKFLIIRDIIENVAIAREFEDRTKENGREAKRPNKKYIQYQREQRWKELTSPSRNFLRSYRFPSQRRNTSSPYFASLGSGLRPTQFARRLVNINVAGMRRHEISWLCSVKSTGRERFLRFH